jgi:hypothetical protein
MGCMVLRVNHYSRLTKSDSELRVRNLDKVHDKIERLLLEDSEELWVVLDRLKGCHLGYDLIPHQVVVSDIHNIE